VRSAVLVESREPRDARRGKELARLLVGHRGRRACAGATVEDDAGVIPR
jgi:hypothetical protein